MIESLLPNYVTSTALLFVILICGYSAYVVCYAIYNVTLHPLAKFPGPRLYGAFNLPWFRQVMKGTSVHTLKKLHDKYGPVLRFAPDALSFTNSQAWIDINSHQKGRKDLIRDPITFGCPPGFNPNMMLSTDEEHYRMRRVFNYAFTDSALRDQEKFVQKYSDLLIAGLREQIDGAASGIVDLTRWISFMTFDSIGDLSFGESFEALNHREDHAWMQNIAKGVTLRVLFMCTNAYFGISNVLSKMIRSVPSVGRGLKTHLEYTSTKVNNRLEKDTDRKDFLSHILKNSGEETLTRKEIISNAGFLIVAGSEPTGTTICGLIWLLLQNPQYLKRLVEEIDASFSSVSEMTFSAAAKLPFLQACIQETLRFYPAGPHAIPLFTPPEGTEIDGKFVPGSTSVSVQPYAAFRSEHNFKHPEQFIPERWLGHLEFETDDRFVCQPFGYGPKACLGKKFAHAQIRSVMTRLLWNFELELCKGQDNWMDQKVLFMWQKGTLNVKLTKRF